MRLHASIIILAGHRDASRTLLSLNLCQVTSSVHSTASGLLAFGLINALDQSGHLTYHSDV